MKILFFGTSDISKSFFESVDFTKHQVVCAVTMPDKPVSRGKKMQAPAVKAYAAEKNIPYIQTDKFTDDISEQIKSYNADVGIIVSYGKIIPERIFSLPKYGCFNIHFSLLPKYRGASPVQQALIDGQKETGVSSFWIEKGLDTGAVLCQKSLAIEDTDNSHTLFQKLVSCGITLMNETLSLIESGQCAGANQCGEPSFCSVFTKQDGKIDWNNTAANIRNLMRGLSIWPGIYTVIGSGKFINKTLKVIDCSVIENSSSAKNGTVIEIKKQTGFVVKCGRDALLITKVQPESKSQMSAWDFINGADIKTGSVFI